MDLIPFLTHELDENCKFNSNIQVDSKGLLGSKFGLDRYFLGYALTRLLLQLALISFLTQSLHLLLRRFNAPRITSEILAGFILGRTVLRRIIGETQEKLFPTDDAILDTLTKLGFVLFMFLVGVKMDPGLIWKAGRKGWTIGLASKVIPVIVSFYVSNKFDTLLPLYRRPSTKTIAGLLTYTPFPVIVALLIDLKILNSELGRLSLASALISDFTSTFFVAILSNMRIAAAGANPMLAVESTLLDVVLMVVIMIIRPLFLLIIKSTPEGKPVRSIYVSFICAWVLASAIISDNIGLPYQLPPFLIGLTVPSGPPLGATITDILDVFVLGLLAPLMLTYSAINIDVLVIYDLHYVGFLWVVIILLLAVKYVCIFSAALLTSVPVKDAVALALIIGTQGVVQASLYNQHFQDQTIDGDALSAVILFVFIVATSTHIIVHSLNDYSRLYTGYEKRSILHTANNSELRVVTCIHRQDDALAVIKLLEASNPSRECPLSVYAIHLVKLVGRSTPLFINHSLGQKDKSGGSCSHHMIDIFESFQHQHVGSTTVQIFTAMSLPKFMDQDICSLAFDKLAALIVLPFHCKWNQHGKVIYEDSMVRTINQKVVELSPCSVGIYVDRRKIRKKTDEGSNLPANQQHQVAIIYLGGSDDREALAYGKRMLGSVALNLTVIRIVSVDDDISENEWEKVLDSESLREIKTWSNVTYQDANVKSGPETATLLKEIVESFDLILVGRRHKEDSPALSGLWEWTDLPELGPIGDFLASRDIDRPVSVLVIQQQR